MSDVSANFGTDIGGDGSTVSNGLDPDTGLRNRGHYTRFVAALAQFVAVSRFVVTMCRNAMAAILGAGNVTGTSVTNLGTGTGNKTFTTQAALGLWPGMPVYLAYQTDPAGERMSGILTAYDIATGIATAAIERSTVLGNHAAWFVGPDAPGVGDSWPLVGAVQPLTGQAYAEWTNLHQLLGSTLKIELIGASTAAAVALQISFYDGTTWSTPTSLTAALTAASAYDGWVMLEDIKGALVAITCSFDLANTAVKVGNSADGTSGTGTKSFVGHPDTGLRGIRIGPASSTFDAGVARLKQHG